MTGEVRILPHHVHRAIHGDGLTGRIRVGDADGQGLPRLHPVADGDPDAVHRDAVRQPFDPAEHRSGQAQPAAEEGVNVRPGKLRADMQLKIPGAHGRGRERGRISGTSVDN